MAIAIRSANKLIFPITSCSNGKGGYTRNNKPPIIISTNPKHINIDSLSNLYHSCNHSPHRFPSSDAGVDAGKLAVAVSHSSVVVSVFADGRDDVEEREKGLFGRILPTTVTPENGELVGFGRAVSDMGLTASIYDVMEAYLLLVDHIHEISGILVIPTLRRLGIGRMIVQQIVRILLSKGIYDISALCSEKERLFLAACGFGDDILGSTTMMYAKTASSNSDNDKIIIRAGRKLLVAPPSRLPFLYQNQPPHIAS